MTLWFDRDNKSIGLNYYKTWEWYILSYSSNKAKKGSSDRCLDISIRIGKLNISYTNWEYNRKYKNKGVV